ncbi:hypothetical protein NPIL_331451, partial [Nephila pilipes]
MQPLPFHLRLHIIYKKEIREQEGYRSVWTGLTTLT